MAAGDHHSNGLPSDRSATSAWTLSDRLSRLEGHLTAFSWCSGHLLSAREDVALAQAEAESGSINISIAFDFSFHSGDRPERSGSSLWAMLLGMKMDQN